MKHIFLFISLAIIGAGLYLKYFYDVPDAQESINFFVSGFLIIIGISGLVINLFWNDTPKNHNNE